MTENQPTVKVRIYRSQAGRHQEYEVPLRDKMSVLNVLQYVSENYDGGLSYYASCRRGLCAGCAVKVNGKAKLACVRIGDRRCDHRASFRGPGCEGSPDPQFSRGGAPVMIRERGSPTRSSRASTTLIKGGYTLDPALPFRRQDLLVEDDRIVEISDSAVIHADTLIDASDKIVAPGLINAHAHASTVLLRGLTDNRPLEPWLLYHMHAGLGKMRPRDLYVSSAIGAMELLRTGTTCVVEHAHVGGVVEELEARTAAVVKGFVDAGLRAVVAPMYSDLRFSQRLPLHLAGEVPPEVLNLLDCLPTANAAELAQGLHSLCRRLLDHDPLISMCLGPANPNSCSRELLERTSELARELDIAIHSHLLESKCMRLHSPAIVEYLAELNFLGPRVSFAHGVWLDDRDIESLARTETKIVHNPISNLKLGSGLAPIQALRARGVDVALGADNAGGANDSQNMFEVMKYAALINKLYGPAEEWIGAQDAFQMCLTNGARITGQAIGSLQPGSLADIIILETGRLFGASRETILNQLVYTVSRRGSGHGDRRGENRCSGQKGSESGRRGTVRRSQRQLPQAAGRDTCYWTRGWHRPWSFSTAW